MKLQFNPNLDFQLDALNAVTDVFKGQEICRTNFTIAPLKYDPQIEIEFENLHNDLGIGNQLKLGNKDILKNIRSVQIRNGLAPSDSLDSLDFTIEMETGTGKTYVYLRSVFELNRLYGLTKFIIVVPSVAIKEGVYKSLQMTEAHFKGLYENIQFDYFIYDPQKIGRVRNFAASNYIQIMLINIDAFRKSLTDSDKEGKTNITHHQYNQMTENRPKEFIQATKPIVIIDDPQSMDTGGKNKKALASLNPLCTFRYSSAHLDKYHLIYKLDSVDAYQRKLVKQIEVAGIEIQDRYNKAFVRIVSDEAYKRLQIRKTIEKHLEKEKELRPRGLKVLSLFFIDRVANYRRYDDKGNPYPGKYAKIFEEEYNREITKPKYYTLFDGADLETPAQDVHDGYFALDNAIDKKKTASGKYVKIFKDSYGEGKAGTDESVYRLIMQDKEKLLSFDTKLKFIFSHSALKKGWDNPNIFQICTLNETASVMKKRQETGCGLRIAVNREGERIHGFDVNTLTVISNESYEEFAKQLQKETEEETGIRFGVNTAKLNIRNADDRKKAELNKAVCLGNDFQYLWENIKYKTNFRINFDQDKLIKKCADEIRKALIAENTRFTATTAIPDAGRVGINTNQGRKSMPENNDSDYGIFDLVSFLQEETNLTRRSIIAILKASGRLQDFKSNSQKFIELVSAIIKHQMQIFIVNGIKYQKMGYHHYYAQEIFKENELYGYLRKNMFESKKSVFDHIVYDSDIEADFARSFELSKEVKVYAKLSGWFKIDTPLGSYNPDWAVLVETDNQQRLFVIETKKSRFSDALKVVENAKIQCGRKHFKVLGNDIKFIMADNYTTFSKKISSTIQKS